jgi:restriction endonuclease Mrr
MRRLLYQSGYLAVHPTGRKHKRGRTVRGGLDLTARHETELASGLTLVQLKQYRRVVSRRFVDELRGAMLRHGAAHGLLLTLSTFSPVAHRAAQDSEVAPITLIEGEEILDLLFSYRIGVYAVRDRWYLDQEYLDFLRKRAMGTSTMKNTAIKNTTNVPALITNTNAGDTTADTRIGHRACHSRKEGS